MASCRRECALVLLLLLWISGCGSSEFAAVRGTVTLDGEPLPEAFVEFYPTGTTGSICFGKTDDSGEYKMEFSADQSGVIPGEYLVRIHTGDLYDDHGNIKRIPERVPVKYNEKSETTITVTEEGPNDFDFDLVSEGEIVEIGDGDAG